MTRIAKHITESLHEGLGWIPPSARIIGVWIWDCEMVCWVEIVRSTLQEARLWDGRRHCLTLGPSGTQPFLRAHLTRPAAPYCPLSLFITTTHHQHVGTDTIVVIVQDHDRCSFRKMMEGNTTNISTQLSKVGLRENRLNQHCQLKFFSEFSGILSLLVLFLRHVGISGMGRRAWK